MDRETEQAIKEHESLANHFADESHKFDAALSDAFSGLAEAHQQYANVLRGNDGEPVDE